MKVIDGLKGLGVAAGLSVLLLGAPVQGEEMDSLDALIDPASVVQVAPVADQGEGLLDFLSPGEVKKFVDKVGEPRCNDGSVAKYSEFVHDYVAKNGTLVDGERTLDINLGDMYLNIRVKGDDLELMVTARDSDNPQSLVSSYFVDKKADGVAEQAVASVSTFRDGDLVSMTSQLYALNPQEGRELLSDDCVDPSSAQLFDTPEGKVVGCMYDLITGLAASVLYVQDCCSEMPVLPESVKPEVKPTGTWL